MQETLTHLIELGHWLRAWLEYYRNVTPPNQQFTDFTFLLEKQHELNNWHSTTDLINILDHWSCEITSTEFKAWIGQFPTSQTGNKLVKTILVKAPENIPLAGLMEWTFCLLTGNRFLCKTAQNQHQILKYLGSLLSQKSPEINDRLIFQEELTYKPDGYILYAGKTDFNSLTRYFATKKALIVEPRITVGILSGKETPEELSSFGTDIFHSLGQSPRTLRKIFIPRGFSIDLFIQALEPYASVYKNNKYANNYDYYQSIYLMERKVFKDNGFLLFKEDASLDAPTGCLYYEYYDDVQLLTDKLQSEPYIEQIISNLSLPVETVKPGKSHFRPLSTYFNRKNLLEFNWFVKELRWQVG